MLSVPPATQSAGRCRRMKDVPLLPAHGDAHPGNLLPTSHGWRWIDCEDVSSMPQFWDLASFFANPALLRGFDPPLIAPAVNSAEITCPRNPFGGPCEREES